MTTLVQNLNGPPFGGVSKVRAKEAQINIKPYSRPLKFVRDACITNTRKYIRGKDHDAGGDIFYAFCFFGAKSIVEGFALFSDMLVFPAKHKNKWNFLSQ